MLIEVAAKIHFKYENEFSEGVESMEVDFRYGFEAL